MNRMRRLQAQSQVDLSRPLNFSFNNKTYQGYEGDTLASALIANGVGVVNRSFKFHRPRGIMSAGMEECNAILAVDRGNGCVPLERATAVKLTEGLSAQTQNCFPSVNFDFGRVLDFTRPLWPAGFYNKIFKWPNWHFYEWAVRATAGMGKVPEGADKARYRHVNTHCDVLIVGAGPSGLAQALLEAETGLDVIIAEQDFVAGGSLLFDQSPVGNIEPKRWLAQTLEKLESFSNVRLMLSSGVAGYYDHNVLTIHDKSKANASEPVDTFWKVRAAKVVLAAGAIEQPLMFGNNDLPGIMLAGAMHKYVGRYGVRCAHSVALVVNNDLGWVSGLALHDAGVKIVAIIDQREKCSAVLLTTATQKDLPVFMGASLQSAVGSKGVKAFKFSSGGQAHSLACDGIAVSGGLNPTVHLFSQAGGKLRYSDELACFVADHCPQNVEVIGAANGDFTEGGLITLETYRVAPRQQGDYSSGGQWVDFAHDVLVSDIELAVRENFVSVEHLKRYTTSGMSIDQGKTSNLNTLSLLATLTGRLPGEVGTTTFRPQYMPVTMGAIAGNRQGDMYHPSRRLVAHSWHAMNGAVFDDFGPWKRPAYYGEDLYQAIELETKAVRNQAGLFDGSPLGKIEVKGPDAAEFLNKIYVNTVPSLKVGMVRYGLMLNENGAIIDDGVFVRLAEEHFLVNTTSAGVDRITAWMEYWHQCEWPYLNLVISPVTAQWSVATVAGPNSREILSQLEGIGDLSTEQMPHMSFRQGELTDGTKFRLQRVSFTGEQSYELSVPAKHMVATLDLFMKLGAPLGLRPFGIEALEVMRLEKGFLHVGADTEGTTNPNDVGFGRIVANKKADFIGRRSLLRSNDTRQGRRQLVGIETASRDALVNVGTHIVSGADGPRRSEGFVTSTASSPTVGRRIVLALLENGQNRLGEEVRLYDNGKEQTGKVIGPCVYDQNGERMNA